MADVITLKDGSVEIILAALRPWRNKVEQIIKIINNQI